MRNNNQAGGVTLPDIRQYYKTTVIKTVVALVPKLTSRPMEQNREPRRKPRHYGQLVFDKEGKNIKWEKDSLFIKWCWENWTVACKSMKLEHTLTPCMKINSK